MHKANVMKQSDGVFLEAARGSPSRSTREIEFDDRRVDSLCCELAMRPGEFDVLVMPLMYGDIVSDLGAGLTGGLGMAPGVNLGDDCAIFEAVHGTAPKHAGRNRVNPIAADALRGDDAAPCRRGRRRPTVSRARSPR